MAEVDVFEADMPEEERVKLLAEMANVSIDKARMMLAIERGEIDGDIEVLEEE